METPQSGLDELEQSYDARVDELRDMAVTFADILLKPAVNDALKREETRKQAHAALSTCIDALAAYCEHLRGYADACTAFHEMKHLSPESASPVAQK